MKVLCTSDSAEGKTRLVVINGSELAEAQWRLVRILMMVHEHLWRLGYGSHRGGQDERD